MVRKPDVIVANLATNRYNKDSREVLWQKSDSKTVNPEKSSQASDK